jgi:REP element-mobilizing transposase RayT
MADGNYHVTSRGLERRDIVRNDGDRSKWASLLEAVALRRGWRIFAWALMNNHFHLYLRTPHGDLSAGMHDLNAGYVTWFNRRHRRCGPLYQGRFKAVLVERRYHAWELTRYIHLNPVRAGLTDRPDTYAWSSCSAYMRPGGPEWLAWSEVLSEHGKTLSAARRDYWDFLMKGVHRPPPSPLSQTISGVLVGTPAFIERVKARIAGHLPDREVPAARPLRLEPTVADIQTAVCREFSVPRDSLLVPHSRNNTPRACAIYLCRQLTRQPTARIGDQFGGVSEQAVSNVAAGIAARRRGDRELESQLTRISERLTDKCKMKT